MEEIVAGIDKILEHFYREKVQLKEGMREILEYFANENVKMCIATANDKCLVEKASQRLEIREYFTDILTCEEVGIGKESPIIYEKALECMYTKKENTVVFEDAIHAIKTVKENGFTVVGVYEESEPDQKESCDVCTGGSGLWIQCWIIQEGDTWGRSISVFYGWFR